MTEQIKTDARYTIGGVKVENPLFFAPLAGVSLAAVRRFFRRLGVGLTHTEMISSSGLIYGGEQTWHMTESTPEEEPLVLQLFTGDVDSLIRSADMIFSRKPDTYSAISLNMACPMPKVMKKGAGSRLLEHPDIAEKMVREIKKFGLPVWPKIRKCVHDARFPLDTLDFTDMLINAGADNVTIHGRTQAQRYLGESDRNEVLRVAKAFPGMVTASGDIYTGEDVKYFLDNGCVAVLAARGAVANPYFVPQTLTHLGFSIQLKDSPSIEQRAADLRMFVNEARGLHGEKIALILLKRFIAGFFRGLNGSSSFRRALATTHGWDETMEIIDDWRSYFCGVGE